MRLMFSCCAERMQRGVFLAFFSPLVFIPFFFCCPLFLPLSLSDELTERLGLLSTRLLSRYGFIANSLVCRLGSAFLTTFNCQIFLLPFSSLQIQGSFV